MLMYETINLEISIIGNKLKLDSIFDFPRNKNFPIMPSSTSFLDCFHYFFSILIRTFAHKHRIQPIISRWNSCFDAETDKRAPLLSIEKQLQDKSFFATDFPPTSENIRPQ